jgi:hypothetical protein
MLWMTLALCAVAGAVAWLAFEMRAVHQAIDAYAGEVWGWQRMLAEVSRHGQLLDKDARYESPPD